MHTDAPRSVSPTLFALALLAAAELGHASTVGRVGLHLPLLWPPVGLLAAGLAGTPRNRWPGMLPAAYAVMVASAALHGAPLVPALTMSGVYVGEALFAGLLLRRLTGGQFDLASVSHLVSLFFVCAVAPIVGGLVGAVILRHMDTPASFGSTWLAWTVTDALGIMLAAPFMFGWQQYPDMIVSPPRWRAVEALGIVAGAALLAHGVFGDGLPVVLRAPAFLLPFFFLAVFRFGPAGAAVIFATVTLVALPNTVNGHGPFIYPGETLLSAVVRGQLIALMTTLSFLLLACVVAERRRIAQQRGALVAELQQAVLEIKTLRGFIPICAWCHRIRDDAGFWQEIEEYVQTHTDATFSHGICPACHTQASREIQEHAAVAARPKT